MKMAIKEVIQKINSGITVFVQGGAATPQVLLKELVEQHDRLKQVELIHLHLEGPQEFAQEKYHDSFKVTNLFVGVQMRKNLDYQNVDYLPCYLSEMPRLFSQGIKKIDVALIHVSPPDEFGYCSLGVSVDIVKAAIDAAKIVIAQVNSKMPRVHGGAFIPFSKIHYHVETEQVLPEILVHGHTKEEIQIGNLVASLVENGATLQMGIGSIPDAVLASLKGHKHLGIHSEMWSDGALELILAGAVDNSLKRVHQGKSVACFIMGSQKVYNFINDNPSVVLYESEYVNSPVTISRNPKVVAINSAVQMDLTGQICADSIGNKIISGVGGQMDFMRGAALSLGGKPVIAITSRTPKGDSKIVSSLKLGSGVVTTRANVHHVVTEYGVANLFGLTLGQRARALTAIAHPDDREGLERQFKADHT